MFRLPTKNITKDLLSICESALLKLRYSKPKLGLQWGATCVLRLRSASTYFGHC